MGDKYTDLTDDEIRNKIHITHYNKHGVSPTEKMIENRFNLIKHPLMKAIRDSLPIQNFVIKDRELRNGRKLYPDEEKNIRNQIIQQTVVCEKVDRNVWENSSNNIIQIMKYGSSYCDEREMNDILIRMKESEIYNTRNHISDLNNKLEKSLHNLDIEKKRIKENIPPFTKLPPDFL